MSRPRKCRFIELEPNTSYFKPRGIPLIKLEEVCLSMGEFEAARLKDLKGLTQEKASRRMKISRTTFQRILAQARKKIAEALTFGKALKIEGGDYEMLKRIPENRGHARRIRSGRINQKH